MPGPSNRTSADTDETLVDIDEQLISQEFARLPARIAYHNGRYADALRASLIAEVNRKRTEARLAISIRVEAQAKGNKLTEAGLRERIENSDEWAESKLEEIDAEVTLAQERGTIEALRAKKDMLVSLGAHIRAELGANPHMRDLPQD